MPEHRQSRIAFLDERVTTAERSQGRTTFDVPFRQRQMPFVKIDVPIGFALYNVLSGRTHRAQSDWIERNGVSPDFFDDPEQDEVQAAQHAILLDMIAMEGLDRDLSERQQRTPAVLTYDGFILDGNRRVAALRDQGAVENIVAVVLPHDATRSEIFETELELQMARETKAEYNWVDQALHVAYGTRELHESIHSVAKRMNESDKVVQAILARLALVDLYLDWLGTAGKYHRIPPDAEQAFIELADREQRQPFRVLPELQRRTIRQACFAVIQADAGGYMDVRRVADALRSAPDEVVNRARERLPDDLIPHLDRPAAPMPQPSDNASGGILAELAADAEMGTPAGAEILNVVSDPGDAQRASPVLIDIATELDEERRESHGNLEPFSKVGRAVKLLQSVHITPDTERLDEVAGRVAEAMVEAERITEQITARRALEQ